jgi:hypothetical protein
MAPEHFSTAFLVLFTESVAEAFDGFKWVCEGGERSCRTLIPPGAIWQQCGAQHLLLVRWIS